MIKIIKGSFHLDTRGLLVFNNDFQYKNIIRSYLVKNKDTSIIRAWHAHQKENKFFNVIQGGFQISAVQIDNFKKPAKNLKVQNFFIKENTGDLLLIPGGYANGFRALYPNSILQIFSNFSLHDSLNDDYRFPYNYWDCWSSENF